MLNRNDIESVNFVIRTKDFTSYEFQLNEPVYVEEAETHCCLFRLDINSDGTDEILVANSEDYDISETVTHLFDVEDIKSRCLDMYVSDITETYIADHPELNLEPDEFTNVLDKNLTLDISTSDLTNVMEFLGIPLTKVNVSKLLDAKVLEKVYSTFKEQLHDEIKFMTENLDEDIYDFCDDCNSVVNKVEGDDFFFEVPKSHSKGLSPNIMVCVDCWVNKGYEKVYNEYTDNNDE